LAHVAGTAGDISFPPVPSARVPAQAHPHGAGCSPAPLLQLPELFKGTVPSDTKVTNSSRKIIIIIIIKKKHKAVMSSIVSFAHTVYLRRS